MTTPLARTARILRSDVPLGTYPERVTDDLVRWAREKPDATFLAERDGEGWRTISYAQTLERVRGIGSALLAAGGSPEHPLAILADNGIDHALVSLAAIYAGIPASPISMGYVAPSADPARLRAVLDVLQPFAAFVPGAGAAARFHAAQSGVPRIDASRLDGDADAADRAHAALTADSIAKVLFTSGSTGTPKGVITTHRMLSANQTMVQQIWPAVTRELVMVDWAPWSHTAAGNKTFGMILRNGGTMYVDAGKPAPGAFDETLRNLREIAPTYFFNVPRGWALLLAEFERDDAFARHFFSRMVMMLNAGAGIPESTRARIASVAREYAGRDVPMVSAWGLTETAPMATAVWGDRPASHDTIGTPVPGVSIKLAPHEDRFELRVHGPTVTPGYWRNPAATAAAFDDEGYFKTGDAGSLLDENDPSRGIVFGGRLTENFKLSTGTWVNAGMLRLDVIEAAGGWIEDVVFAGTDRDDLTAIVFPARDRVHDPDMAARVRAAIADHNARNPATSTRIVRYVLADSPPDGARGEITDKGSVNQRRVLENRADLVARLYATPPGAGVVTL